MGLDEPEALHLVLAEELAYRPVNGDEVKDYQTLVAIVELAATGEAVGAVHTEEAPKRTFLNNKQFEDKE